MQSTVNINPSNWLWGRGVWVMIFGILLTAACSPQLEFSQRKEVAVKFMNALASGDQATATSLSLPTEENKLAVNLMVDAIKLKIQSENIKDFKYIYLSDTQDETNVAKVVFSQSHDGKVKAENLVVELVYDKSKSEWLVRNLLMKQ
jgi:hypothetical protein